MFPELWRDFGLCHDVPILGCATDWGYILNHILDNDLNYTFFWLVVIEMNFNRPIGSIRRYVRNAGGSLNRPSLNVLVKIFSNNAWLIEQLLWLKATQINKINKINYHMCPEPPSNQDWFYDFPSAIQHFCTLGIKRLFIYFQKKSHIRISFNPYLLIK